MFGLTKREQRWAAEQKAVETILGFAGQVVAAKAASNVQTFEAVLVERHALKAELAALKAQRVLMSDEQIDTITREQWGTDHSSLGYLAHRTYARAVLKAHHNIQDVKP